MTLQASDLRRESLARIAALMTPPAAIAARAGISAAATTPCHTFLMPDSDALRSRRKRLHAAGNHSLCRRCASAPVLAALPEAVAAPVDTLASLEGLARRLEAAHEADPANSRLAAELRATLLALRAQAPPPEPVADPMEELRALAADVS
jgi:hypothetical protein